MKSTVVPHPWLTWLYYIVIIMIITCIYVYVCVCYIVCVHTTYSIPVLSANEVHRHSLASIMCMKLKRWTVMAISLEPSRCWSSYYINYTWFQAVIQQWQPPNKILYIVSMYFLATRSNKTAMGSYKNCYISRTKHL